MSYSNYEERAELDDEFPNSLRSNDFRINNPKFTCDLRVFKKSSLPNMSVSVNRVSPNSNMEYNPDYSQLLQDRENMNKSQDYIAPLVRGRDNNSFRDRGISTNNSVSLPETFGDNAIALYRKHNLIEEALLYAPMSTHSEIIFPFNLEKGDYDLSSFEWYYDKRAFYEKNNYNIISSESCITKNDLKSVINDLRNLNHYDPSSIRTPISLYFILSIVVIINISG